MLRAITVVIIYLLSLGFCHGQNSETKLTEDARISLITCGAGQELYSSFGHSALRVYDPGRGDIVFNYGTFSFNQPNFYLRFAQGRLLYRLSVEPYQMFKEHYIADERSMVEQVLNLDANQKQRLYSLLAENYQPENREYRYHFFDDNCSTRIRDIVEQSLNHSVQFHFPDSSGTQTFRALTDIYLESGNQYWGDYGIDLALGLPTDDVASGYAEMFLPDYLMNHFDNARIVQNGSEKPLVAERLVLYDSSPAFPSPFITPAELNWGIFILIMLIVIVRRRTIVFGWFDYILFGIVGLLGCALLLLWIATDHTDARNNFNLLWALPTHLLLMPFYAKNLSFRKFYFGATGLIGLVLLVMWPILPQHLHYACIPLALLLSLRSYYLYRTLSMKTSQHGQKQ